ncbi:polysaccharide deacetylase family protein [Micromonospora sp. NBC_01699]|uniref:polysaccharide deacetylase family protein n=1 Tax=Micromonospora sp. NBC_01699 TaxID=2975984 RepID=UPI002E2AEE33|nr:polysaccharide deacetylase family protein [Micromonospora sp. NBC_01699]
MGSTRGGRASTGRYGPRRSGLTGRRQLRLIMILGLVVGSMLGGGYLLGHTFVGSGPSRDPLGEPGPPSPSRPATGSPTPDPPHSASPSATTAPTRPAPIRSAPTRPAPIRSAPTHSVPVAPAPASPARSAEPVPEAPLADDRPRLPMGTGGPYSSRISTGSRGVALTFDDGPNPVYTPQVLAELARFRVRATFCLVGELAAAYPELVRAIAAAGHTLCNHSWSHDPDLGSRSKAAIRTDLTRTNAAIRAAVPDALILYYRQPYGGWTAGAVATARELGMTSVHWDVDAEDYSRPGAGNIASNVTAGVVPGSIVLMHDAGGNRQQTITALRTILPNLLRRLNLVPLPTGPPQNNP